MTRKEIKLKQNQLSLFKKFFHENTLISSISTVNHQKTALFRIIERCVVKITSINKVVYEVFIIHNYDDGYVIFIRNGYAPLEYRNILDRCYIQSIEITTKSYLKLFDPANANWDLTLAVFKGYPFDKWWPMYKRAVHQFDQLQLCRSASYMHYAFPHNVDEWSGVYKKCLPDRFDMLTFDYIGYGYLLPFLWPEGFKIWFKIPSFKKQFIEQKMVQQFCMDHCVSNRHLIIIEKLQLQ